MGRLVCVVCLLSLRVSLAQPGADPKPEAVLFDALPVVEAASLHTQSLMEAPASVTVITDEDIRRRGYRTLAEALADVRGMYVTYDRIYDYVGVRGFSIPGDLSTRFLVMVDGHPLTDNIYRSGGAFGQEFGIDMDLIQRIEIVRGPSSAMYGSNGMFATVNIVTKSPVEYQAFRVSAETDSFGERKAQVSSSEYLGKGANLLISASVFNNIGQSLYFPQFDSPETNHGWAVNMDGEKGYHAFANLIWHDWSFLAYFDSREKQVPTGAYGAIFNDRGTHFTDGRGFVDSSYQHNLGAGQLRWRVYYDQYRSTNRAEMASDIGTLDGRQGGEGDWVGTQLTYRFPVARFGYLTIGSEASWDLRTRMYAYYAAPFHEDVLSIDRLNRSGAVFVQDEWDLSRHWKAYLGGRLDASRYHDLALTPRIGLVYQPSESTAWKLLYGRSFRNPSAYEQFYADGVTQEANPALNPEHMQTYEGALEKRLGKKLELSANLYHYRLADLITIIPLNSGLEQYNNAASMHSTGLELESKAEIGARLKLDASLAVQGSGYGAATVAELNSPARVGKLLMDAQLFGGRLLASGALQYESDRGAFGGGSVPDVYLVNVSFDLRRLPNDLEMQFGVRNLLNRRYWDPVNVAEGMDRLEQDGRCFFVRLSWVPQSEQKSKSSSGIRPVRP